MFCSNCGKQLENNVSFCSGCGVRIGGGAPRMRAPYENSGGAYGRRDMYENAPMNGMPAGHVNLDVRIVWIVMAVISTVFVGLAGVLPIMTIDAGWLGDSMNTIDMFKYAMELKEYSDEGAIMMLVVVIGIALICYIASVIFGFIAILNFLTGKTDDYITDPMSKSMRYGMAHLLIPMILGFIINKIAEDEFFGYEFFSPTALCWVILVVAFINLSVFIRGYLDKDIFGIVSPQHQRENEEIAGGKICLVCKTEFMIGNSCPRCGSPAIRNKN